MRRSRQQFDVEHAGCSACAERLRAALSPLATVEQIEVDEDADRAVVVIASEEEISEDAVGEALARASLGSGHEYRVKTGSWRDAT
jgi:cation transport ATPase